MSTLLALYPDWLIQHGAALVVIVPLLAAGICAIYPHQRSVWVITFSVCFIGFITAIGLVLATFTGSPIEYELGGWAAPHGIVYWVDALSAPIVLLISFIALLGILHGRLSIPTEIEPKKRAPFYAAFLICLAGLLGMVVTGDAFNIFVFLEVSSIATYSLVAMGTSRDRRALSAAYNYLILGSIGATFFVIGLGFLYMETGTLNMADIGRILRLLDGGSRVAEIAFGFIIIGLGLKLAMFPLHMWLSNAYTHAPSFVTTFLAATATKAALYLMLRFSFNVFDPDFEYVRLSLSLLLRTAAILAMILMSLQAIFQTDIRRTLAFSSIAQVGYILLGISLATLSGLAAAYIHMINHALIKGALFMAMSCFWYRYGITRIRDFNGLARLMPWTMAGFTIAGLSLIGVPLTAGFVSKWQLASAVADSGQWWAVSIIMLSSILAIVYIGRITLAAYFKNPPEGHEVRIQEPLIMLIPMWILVCLSIYIGFHADFIVSLSSHAADILLGTSIGALP